MSVPAIRRSTIESSSSRKAEIQALSDISFHRVWWRRRWVLWFDEPFAFESQRPWSHGSLPRHAAILLLTAAAALWVLTVTLGGLGLLVAAIATSGATAAIGAAIVRAELKFRAWWTQNDDPSPLDVFRRPARLHMAVTTSESALQALTEAGDPASLARDFALEHARRLAGWRTYGTQGWVRLSDIADTEPLLELHAATSQWRALNESWTDEDEWEARFSGETPALRPRRPRRFLKRILARENDVDEDPVDEISTRLRTAARATRRALETAANRGIDKTLSLRTANSTEGPHNRSVIPTIVIAPILAAIAVFGITLANTPGLAEQIFPKAPIAAPEEHPDAPNTAPDSVSEDPRETPINTGTDPSHDDADMPPMIDFLTERVFALVVPLIGLTLIFLALSIALKWSRGW